ncbi:trehalose-6-phosphate synthase [Altererythrobacter sp. KTW20L]|uniref:alpha,alpha-trehalose-phosphate synthase (UDP-forming) n=1 Tax=Altererythrobacter sp. KTW20L TaxID=2942210 RepID=UPI0020BE1422|nr:trehalose-6-phosphate synthase [Altererythrobacter sp. KTW20L]MCL6251596.1 trehalose-6-phosphate synthase [Altererythrobacter sp. KTW20L]
MSRLVVVSNRVAVPTARGAQGAQGGLAGALLAALREAGGLWFGWSGKEAETPSVEPHMQEHDGVTMATIDLAQQDIDEYYNGYANSTLWPLFHYRLDLTQYERDTAMGYERVNELFADSLTPLVREDDLIWIHDYHLIPLGDGLRRRGVRNRMGFFLHIPWPPTRLFVSLPYHERLVQSLLAYDVIGFQCDEWLESFLHYCRKELGATVDDATGRIDFEGRTVIARAYPIGIDYDHFMAQGDTGDARQAAQRVLSSTRRRTAMIGVDRLDYSKGLPERMDGVSRFFDRHPERVNDLVFIQIAPPSREDIGSYQQIRATLEQKAGQINGARSRIDLVPVRYVNQGHTTAELFGCYRACKIGLVTPLRDGMNLVAKEYVAAQDPDDPGVLILSRFAGAAQQLPEALLVNPYSPDDIASMIQRALDMPLEERKERWQAMNECVRDCNVTRWTQEITRDIASAGLA